MKTLYYYFKWLWKQFKFESIYIVFLAAILFITGIIMNMLGLTIHSKLDENGHLVVWRDEYWNILGDKFWVSSIVLFAIYIFWVVIVGSFRKSFNRFKQEQHDLLKTIDKGYQ